MVFNTTLEMSNEQARKFIYEYMEEQTKHWKTELEKVILQVNKQFEDIKNALDSKQAELQSMDISDIKKFQEDIDTKLSNFENVLNNHSHKSYVKIKDFEVHKHEDYITQEDLDEHAHEEYLTKEQVESRLEKRDSEIRILKAAFKQVNESVPEIKELVKLLGNEPIDVSKAPKPKPAEQETQERPLQQKKPGKNTNQADETNEDFQD